MKETLDAVIHFIINDRNTPSMVLQTYYNIIFTYIQLDLIRMIVLA